MTLLRSNIEFSKRVFLDRLTTDAQPLLQPKDIDAGPGDLYIYSGVGNSGNFGIGFDCSGLAGVVLAIALYGPQYFAGTGYTRLFSTETFPGPLPGFTQCASSAELLASSSPIKVGIMHGGGGPNSHMAVWMDGWNMESNGQYGICADPPEITGIGSDYWNDWWVYTGSITEDTTERQQMTYPQGLDYAGGAIAGADLAAAGISFVCRYVAPGGSALPAKQLTGPEFTDLLNNGIAVVFNWEVAGNAALNGANQGAVDAEDALSYIMSLPGSAGKPVVYFSVDFDAAPADQTAINAYLQAAAVVLGGPQYVGIYGGYWPLSRALDAGVCDWAWQTEAWSGTNIDSRVNIMQRNSLGYTTIGGVQCDVDEAHTTNFGQFLPSTPVPVPTPVPVSGKPPDEPTQVSNIWDQLLGATGKGWPQINNHTVVDALAEIGQKLGIPGYVPPTQGN
jgi:hypothetical protein